jgi:dTMP kinase
MKTINHKGLLICLCGVDGCGKTTHEEKLSSYLQSKNYSVIRTKQPTNWYRQNELVRRYLRGIKGEKAGVEALALFSAADRVDHIKKIIRPALDSGAIVISNRYVYSAYAYFLARGLNDIDWLKNINKYAIQPDLSVLIDIPVNLAYSRIIQRDGLTEKSEEKDPIFLEKVRDNFLAFVDEGLLIYIDGTQSVENIHERIISLVKPLLHQYDKRP